MINDLEKKLNTIKTKDLTVEESATLWQKIWQSRGQQYSWSLFILLLKNKNMLALVLAFLILFSGSVATVRAADNAKPGDVLFSLDRAIENIQLSLSGPDKKNGLKVKFAQERAGEISAIIDDQGKSKDQSKKQNSDERIKAALNVVTEFKDDVNSSRDTLSAGQMQSIVDNIIKELSNVQGPFEWQTQFHKDNNAKFKIEAEEEDNKIKLKIRSKKFIFEDNFRFSSSTATSTPSGDSLRESKIIICHLTANSGFYDLKIAQSALAVHLAHGDKKGECPDNNDDNNKDRSRDREEDNASTISTSTPPSIDPIQLNDEARSGSNNGSADNKNKDDQSDRGRGADDN